MSTWLTARRNREESEPTGPVMELLVVEGADAGNQFTLEGNEVMLGRGQPSRGQIDVIRLSDKSISRKQAWIRRDASGTSVEHIATAANPTRVNGAEVSRARLAVGDRIEMGRVAIDVRAREGLNLSGLTEIMEDAARENTLTAGALRSTETPPVVARSPGPPSSPAAGTLSSLDGAVDATDVRPVEVVIGDLIVASGVEALPSARFPIGMSTTTIGRGDDVDVQIPERGVSRLHAEIEIAGRSLLLVHKSGTNQTFVNGLPVFDRIELEHGDEIQLADQVVLRVELATNARPPERAAPSLPGSALSQRMEDKLELERKIEEFSVMGSFLDVDVVESRKMKGGGEKAEHIIVSFDRFRGFVSGICGEFEGQVLNSNGDELMCFFESPESALLAGSAILERLEAFNADSNLLGRPFRFRIGAHTGLSFVDLSAGIAYSDVLDTAGHIQKHAEPNTMLVSRQTLDRVGKRLPVTRVGELAGDGGMLYRVDRFLSPEDVYDED